MMRPEMRWFEQENHQAVLPLIDNVKTELNIQIQRCQNRIKFAKDNPELQAKYQGELSAYQHAIDLIDNLVLSQYNSNQ
ncbi:hypothetical protein [Laspinema palackyanum]|uniref:hypothetical protein n=1 Tax=Laspinema palackyanum TaxID=3231601 RepID=UPI00345D9118|nr:hypothetical protein [Laspinema sp. D2c]